MTANGETAEPGQRTAGTAGVVRAIVGKRIFRLQVGAVRNDAASVAALARLRRGAGKPPGAVPDILAYTLADEFVENPRDDQPTRAEIAAHIAMTLYAVHQQSQSRHMHQNGWGVGRALRALVPDGDSAETPIHKRFAMLGTADSLDELVHHLRGAVQLLRSKPVPLDYGLLADQLVRWQRHGGAHGVRLAWGREFYFPAKSETETDGDTP